MKKSLKCFLFVLSISIISGIPSYSKAAVLDPGTIYSCGEIVQTGTYTLDPGSTFDYHTGGIGNACFTITSGGNAPDTVIDGSGLTITGDVNGNGSNPGDSGQSFTLQNITVIGTSTVDGASIDDCSNNAGWAGNISIIEATTSATANGGSVNCEQYTPGNGGTITVNNTNVSNGLVFSVLGGSGSSHRKNGSLTFNYTTFDYPTYSFPTLNSLTLNGPGNLPGTFFGNFSGGLLTLPGSTITNASQCFLTFPGTYTLGANINGNCILNNSDIILNGSGHTVSGDIIATSTGNNNDVTGNGYNITLNNIIVNGKIDTSGATHPAPVTWSDMANGYAGGSVTISNSTTTSIITDGSYEELFWSYMNSYHPGNNAGAVSLTNTVFKSIHGHGGDTATVGGYGGYGSDVTISKNNLDLSSTTISISHGNGPQGYGYHQHPCIGSCDPFVAHSNLDITSSSTTENSNTYFLGVNSLTINGNLYGPWNGLFNTSSVFYFNDKASGAGNDGDWNNPLNWYFDSIFSIGASGIPNTISNIIASGTISQNTGSPVSIGSIIFNNASQNDVDMTARYGFIFNNSSINTAHITGNTSFNDSSINNGSVTGNTTFNDNSIHNGTTTGTTIFVGNSAEDNGVVITPIVVSTSSQNIQSTRTIVPASPDGGKAYAIIRGTSSIGQIFTSEDFGQTWKLNTASPKSNWNVPYNTWGVQSVLTSSVDGSRLVGVNIGTNNALNDGQIYTSSDSAHSWNISTSSPVGNWSSVSASANGEKVVGVNNGNIYYSNDYGINWYIGTSSPVDGWSLVNISGDGLRLTGMNGSDIYTSTDSGSTWDISGALPSGSMKSISIPADSTNFVVATNHRVYTSTDSGHTWNTSTSSPYFGIDANIASTPDGANIAVVVKNLWSVTGLYVSTDYGLTWKQYESGRDYTISSLSFTSDGTKLFAGFTTGIDVFDLRSMNVPIRQYNTNTNVGTRDFTDKRWIIRAVSSEVDLSDATYSTSTDTFEALDGGSFVSNSSINSGAPVVPQITITSPTSDTIIKWTPIIDWGNSVVCQYSYGSFDSLNPLDCSKNGSDIPKPSSSGSKTLFVQGTDSIGNISQKSVVFTYDNTSPIYTSCGTDILDESSRQYYYLENDITGNCTATTNVELRGASSSSITGYTINGNFIGTSTTNGHNIVLKNISITGDIVTNGSDSESVGYSGGNINISTSTTGNIYSKGGNGSTKGGNGGLVSVLNSTQISTSTLISVDGGSATSCGYGGNGGSVSLINSTYTDISTNSGNDMLSTIGNGGFCPNPPTGSSGHSGSRQIIGSYILSTPTIQNNDDKLPPTPTPPSKPSGSSSHILPPTPPTEITQNNPVVSQTITPPTSVSLQRVIKATQDIVDSPVSKTVQTVGFFAGLLASIAVYANGMFATPLVAGEALLIPVRLWGLALMTFGLKKRIPKWGTVYDSVTKQPIDPAFVTAKNEQGIVVAESITDIDGRYGFLLPDGKYYISVEKTHYVFPSKKLQGKTADELYRDIYYGEPITIQAGQVITKNIPLDQEGFDWNEEAKREKNALVFHSKNEKPLRKLSNVVFGIGLVISIISLAVNPSIYNIIIVSLYLAVSLMLHYGIVGKKLGLVLDKNTNEPLSYAIFRVTSSVDHETVIRSGVCDERGRYYCIVPKGQYYLDIEKKNTDGTYTKVYSSNLLSGEEGIINKNFAV